MRDAPAVLAHRLDVYQLRARLRRLQLQHPSDMPSWDRAVDAAARIPRMPANDALAAYHLIRATR